MKKRAKNEVRYPWSGLRVLIADDVSVSVDVLRNMLVSLGLVVDVAYRGDEALERLQRGSSTVGGYALAFFDIYMPGLTGIDAVSRFRASGAPDALTLPIVGMSSDAEPLLVERAHAAGMNVLLLKPVVRQMLTHVLATVFDVGQSQPSTAFPSADARLVFLESDSRSQFTLTRSVIGAKRFAEATFDVVPHPCFLKNVEDSRYLRINRAMAEMLGLDRLAIVGCTAEDLFDSASAKTLIEHDRQTLAASGIVAFEERIRVRGVVRTLDKTQAVVEGEDGRRYIMGFVHDRPRTEAPPGGRKEADNPATTLVRGLRAPTRTISSVIELLRQGDNLCAQESCADLLEGALSEIRRLIRGASTLRRAHSGERKERT